ncbi:MAG TPA: MOSC domain-containing protein [Stenotrophobium sp.]|jgi:MOSC domain-containing protein YiiM|nr:MOSC domain-containing protein [Stenotrophobium sp.]
MRTRIDAVFVGGVRPMPGDGRPTGFFKQAVHGAVAVGTEGLAGDQQADRRVHGGPEKAVHHFPAENLARLALAFPAQAAQFIPGGMGENISTRGWTEAEVCIGDVYRLGSARIQLSQPRSPCWKIDARHGAEGITEYVHEHGIAGWYYRVLTAGVVAAGDDLELLERNPAPVSLSEYWKLLHTHRPTAAALLRVIDTPGLAPSIRERLCQRLQWLRENGALAEG